MKVNIKRIDKGLPLPVYETAGSVSFDLICRRGVTIPAKQVQLIPCNIIVKIPKGYMLSISLRSSTPRKYSLLMPHGIGVIDQDYYGEKDEISVQVYNFGIEQVLIERGDKIAQGIFIKIGITKWNEIEIIEDDSRGGFGSTDKENTND